MWKAIAPADGVGKRLMMALIIFGLLLLLTESSAISSSFDTSFDKFTTTQHSTTPTAARKSYFDVLLYFN